MDQKLKNMRKESKTMTPSIIIGKNGITDEVIKNIKQELFKNSIVKIKILQTYIADKDKKDVFEEITQKTGGKIVQTIGFTISLTKR